MATRTGIDRYLADVPPDQRALLAEVRAEVRRLAPEAVELISYGMPAFKYRDRWLIGFAAWKRHCSIYAVPDAVLATFAHELEGYGRTKGSLHFSPRQPLPAGLLEALIRFRVADIEAGTG